MSATDATRSPASALVAAALVGVQVGSSMVATRYVIDQLGPTSLAVLRYLIGVICLLPALWLVVRARFAARDLLPMALLGIGQFGILIALLNYGLQYVSAGRASLLFASFPLMTMLLATGLGLERLSLMRSLGVLLTIAGVGFALGDAVLQRAPGVDVWHYWIGVLAVLLSAFTGAVCSVFYRPYLRRYPTVQVSAFSMAAAVAALAGPALAEGVIGDLPGVTTVGWAAVAFIGVGSAIGYFLWLYALRHASPTSVTVFQAVGPVTAIVLGAWLLSEAVSPLLIVGLVCVAAGLWFATRAGSGGVDVHRQGGVGVAAVLDGERAAEGAHDHR